MSKARDISNLFSASTSAATDAEVTSAVAAHAASTTNRHYKSGDTASRPASPTTGDIYSNTETGVLEIYESTLQGKNWFLIGFIKNLFLLLSVILLVKTTDNITIGSVVTVYSYVNNFLISLLSVPVAVEMYSRLSDILKRIN